MDHLSSGHYDLFSGQPAIGEDIGPAGASVIEQKERFLLVAHNFTTRQFIDACG